MHQSFLTPSTLYAIVCDISRLDQALNMEKLLRWVTLIMSCAPAATLVLIGRIGSHADEVLDADGLVEPAVVTARCQAMAETVHRLRGGAQR